MDRVQIALLILTFIPGLFFAVSGFRKLFFRHVREKVFGLFDKLGVAAPVRWMIVGGEFFGGLGLMTGILSQWAALGLLLIMFGAYFLDTLPGIKKAAPDGYSGWCSKLICNPEALLIVCLMAIALIGERHLTLASIFGVAL